MPAPRMRASQTHSELLRGQVHVWALRPQAGAPWTGLTPQERARAAGFRVPEAAAQFVTGRVAVRMLLAQATGIPAGSVAVVPDHQGRPTCPGSGIAFSVSHTSGCVLVALSRQRVGVDVEPLASAPRLRSIAPAVLDAAERAGIAGLAPADQDVALVRAWTAKESYLKGIGTGLDRRPADVTVDWAGGVGRVRGAPAWQLHVLGLPHAHVGTVASECHRPDVRLFRTELLPHEL